MSMTREEAVARILDHMEAHRMGVYPHIKIKEALDLALTALHGPTREQVEKMRGEWIGDNGEKVGTIDGTPLKSSTCSNCGNWLVGSDEYSCAGYFCPSCGAPMTDEAVGMMLERWKKVLDGE